MFPRRLLTSDEIAQYLKNDEEDLIVSSSSSEIDDSIEEDDVESDAQDVPSDSENSVESLASTAAVRNEMSSSSIIYLTKSSVRGKNGYVWATSKGRTAGKTSTVNIIRASRGPSRTCKEIVDPLTLFELFFTAQMIQEIVRSTNITIIEKINKHASIKCTENETSIEEIKALLGILILSAALKNSHLTSEELFNVEFCGTRYVSCMSRGRFDFLIRCLCFDDKSLRARQRETDPLIPIRNIWDLLMIQCRNNYAPGTNVTIDEQLLAFRGKCKFKMYIPNKPAKYGLKIVMMCDSGTKYMVDAMPYLGKRTNTSGLPLAEYYVKELTKTIHGSSRNVTMDHWFTSISLAKQLMQQPYKLTIVGTVRATIREIPEELKNNRTRATGTSVFCYDGELTLLSYKPKPAKMVYVLSSCDEEGTVNPTSKKPSMIEYYNATKSGVDTFDQMCSTMSCSRKTNRWTMCFFYGMMNIATINSYIVYYHNTLCMGQKPMQRRNFLKKLHSELVEPWMKERLEMRTMPRTIKDNIKNILNLRNQGHDQSLSSTSQQFEVSTDKQNNKRKICSMCSYKKRRMTTKTCSKCMKAICGEHTVDFCVTCAQD